MEAAELTVFMFLCGIAFLIYVFYLFHRWLAAYEMIAKAAQRYSYAKRTEIEQHYNTVVTPDMECNLANKKLENTENKGEDKKC